MLILEVAFFLLLFQHFFKRYTSRLLQKS